MKGLMAVCVLVLSLCGCVSNGYVAGGVGRLDEDRGLYEEVVRVGLLRGGDNGWVGEAALGVGIGDHDDMPLGAGSVDVQTTRVMLDLGVRRDICKWFWLGAGLSPQVLRAQTSVGEDETGMALAAYAGGGVAVDVGKGCRVGIEYRQTFGAQFDLGDSRDVDFDMGAVMLSIGWGF